MEVLPLLKIVQIVNFDAQPSYCSNDWYLRCPMSKILFRTGWPFGVDGSGGGWMGKLGVGLAVVGDEAGADGCDRVKAFIMGCAW